MKDLKERLRKTNDQENVDEEARRDIERSEGEGFAVMNESEKEAGVAKIKKKAREEGL